MFRTTLPDSRIHPAIRPRIAAHHEDIVREVEAAIAGNDIVVVGMKQNPVVKQAKKRLDATGRRYAYLEYGSYFSNWRRRNALKMWSGWPTFPMVFVNGVLIGGDDDLRKLIESDELSATGPVV